MSTYPHPPLPPQPGKTKSTRATTTPSFDELVIINTSSYFGCCHGKNGGNHFLPGVNDYYYYYHFCYYCCSFTSSTTFDERLVVRWLWQLENALHAADLISSRTVDTVNTVFEFYRIRNISVINEQINHLAISAEADRSIKLLWDYYGRPAMGKLDMGGWGGVEMTP